MDIVIGNKAGRPLQYNGKLMGMTGTEYPYFLTSTYFNRGNNNELFDFTATIEYADGTSRTATISPNTSYTYEELLNGNSTYITRIWDISLVDGNTPAGQALNPASITIMSRYPILRSVHRMLALNNGAGWYPTGHNPINLDNLNTANVADFSEMFYGWNYWWFDKLDLSHLNTENGENFNAMFSTLFAYSGTDPSQFTIDLSGFNMAKAITQESYDLFASSGHGSVCRFKPYVIVDGCDANTVAKIKWSYDQHKGLSTLEVIETTVDGKHALVAVEVSE